MYTIYVYWIFCVMRCAVVTAPTLHKQLSRLGKKEEGESETFGKVEDDERQLGS